MNFIKRKKLEKLANDIADLTPISPALFEAFCSVDREEFVFLRTQAYDLNPQPILANQWISSPLTVAKMSMALELEGVDKILEIGCGSGYQAAILSKIIRRVFTIERIERLANEAKAKFKKLNISNINVRYDDGNCGWKNYAPYERILLSAATKKIDQRLFDQLQMEGILVAPLESSGKQHIVKFKKTTDENGEVVILKTSLQECDFVPLLKGVE